MAAFLKKLRGKKYIICLALIFAVGCFVRLAGLDTVIGGFNQDEASVAYDAFSIANYGIDRNGVSLPAYLIAWGSGQNAGYAYLLIPFIKLLGLNVFAVRLPMAIAGCVSLYALYTILAKTKNRRLVLIGTFIFAIFPWHIAKSRWGLESNIFPDIVFWGVALLITGVHTTKKRWFYFSFFVFGLSAWFYAVSYLYLPLFLMPVALVLLKKRAIKPRHMLGCFAVLAAAAWPIILFSLVLVFDLPTISLPFLTIPHMPFSRTGEFVLLSDNPISGLVNNVRNLVQMFFWQQDGWPWTAVPGFGLFYLLSLPLIAVGFFRSVLPEKYGGKYRDIAPGSWVFLPMLLSGLLTALLLSATITRANMLWIPLGWYWIVGVYDLAKVDRFWQKAVVITYTVYFVFFVSQYTTSYSQTLDATWNNGFLEAVRFADTLEVDEIFVTGEINQPYIHVLFALETPVEEFRESIISEDAGVYGTITAFGKWRFFGPPTYELDENFAIIINAETSQYYYEQGWDVYQFKTVAVATCGAAIGSATYYPFEGRAEMQGSQTYFAPAPYLNANKQMQRPRYICPTAEVV